MSNEITVRVSSLIAESEEVALRKLIAWELIGRSVNELHDVVTEWQAVERDTEVESERRFANALWSAAAMFAGEAMTDDESDDAAPQILYRGDLSPLLEAAAFGIETAYGDDDTELK